MTDKQIFAICFCLIFTICLLAMIIGLAANRIGNELNALSRIVQAQQKTLESQQQIIIALYGSHVEKNYAKPK